MGSASGWNVDGKNVRISSPGRSRWPGFWGSRSTVKRVVSPSCARKFPRRLPPICHRSGLAWISYEHSRGWSAFSRVAGEHQRRVWRRHSSAVIIWPTAAWVDSVFGWSCSSAVCTTWISGTSTGMTIRRDGMVG